MVRAYQLVSRPVDVEHEHPFIVYDVQRQLHYPLTRFGKFATKSCTLATVRGYLYALLPYFTWLDTDPRQIAVDSHWLQPAKQVRACVDDYLTQQMHCQIQEHKMGFQFVRRTSKTPSTPSQIQTFLTALKCFYKLMKQKGYYPHLNPLVDSSAAILAAIEADREDYSNPPRMPAISGVEKPNSRVRLTDSYFKLEGDEWVPQIIDTPNLPQLVLAAGRQLSGWGLREECVTRLVFESGGRISEVVGPTLADWMKYGLKREIHTFSKGSRGIRVKSLRFSMETSTLLRRYFNTVRVKFDPNGYTLYDYQEQAKLEQVDLTHVPLFLSQQRTPFSPENFRDNYWKPACDIAGIEADLHQARHWYVTQAIRQIYETAHNDGDEVERLKRSLQNYMKWKSDSTIKAYDHYFDSLAHAKLQDTVFERMDWEMNQYLEAAEAAINRASMAPPFGSTSDSNLPVEDEDFDFLRRIGG
jgi:hypothetical protein